MATTTMAPPTVADPPDDSPPSRRGGGAGQEIAGFLLAALLLGWVVLPFIRDGGPTGVRNMLRAKFLNKGPDGKPLP